MKLDVSTGLAVIGVIATVVLGVWSVSLAIKRRYPGHITFFADDSISLFDDIVRNLPDLEVLYKGRPVSQNLVLFKGILLNTGIVDITPQMVEQKLSIGLPEGFKWLEARVGSSSENVRAEVRVIDDSSLVFDTGLFRCNEYIRFEALAEVPLRGANEGGYSELPDLKLQESLNFTHRIANTRQVAQQSFRYDSLSELLFMAGVILMITCIVIYLALSLREPYMDLTFLLKTDGDKIVEVRISPRSDGRLRVEGVNEQYNEMVSLSEFFSRREWEPKVVARSQGIWGDRFLEVSFFLLLSVLVMVFFRRTRRYIRKKKLRKLLELSSKPALPQSN